MKNIRLFIVSITFCVTVAVLLLFLHQGRIPVPGITLGYEHPVVREAAAGAVVDGKWYLFTGFAPGVKIVARTEMYDPETGQWTTLRTMPTPVTHANALPVGKQIWFMGGFIGDDPGPTTTLVQIYDVASDQWHEGPPLPESVGSAGSVLYNGKIHYFGGTYPDRQTNTSKHYVLDVSQPEAGWQPAAPMPIALAHFSAVVLNDKIYAIGGEYGHSVISVDTPYVQVYDPATDSWERKGDLPFPMSHMELSTFVHEGRIIMIGGKSYRQLTIPTILSYDPGKDSWQAIGNIPEPLLVPTAALIDDDLYVAFGGVRNYMHPNGKLWIKRNFKVVAE